MKLLSIALHNFRAFYGTQRLELSHAGERNTTLIYGANGAGKTTLLNAFTWALYNKFTPAFENPDKLISKKAIADAPQGTDIDCFVEIVFEQNGEQYTVRRSQVERRTANGTASIEKATLAVSIRRKSGRDDVPDNPQDIIEQVLPSDLYSFFFFDGERIEKLVQSQGKSDIARAIKSLLDLEIIERAVRHLSEAQRQLEKEIDDGPASEMTTLREALERHRGELEEANKQLADDEQNAAAMGAEIAAIESKLRGLEQAKTLQTRRDELKKSIDRNDRNIADAQKTLNEIISTDGFTVFLRNAITKTNALIEERRAKGQLPAGISEVFINDLLEAGHCVCGTAISKGDEHYLRLREVLKTAGRPAVESAMISLAGTCKHYTQRAQPVLSRLHEQDLKISNFRAENVQLEERLSEVSSQLKNQDSEDIAALEDRRASILPKQRQYFEAIGRVKDRIKVLSNIIKGKEKMLNDVEIKDAKAAKARDRVKATMEVRDALDEILRFRTAEVRTRLNRQVRDVYSSITFKNYTPIVDDDFTLKLVHGSNGDANVEDPIAKSTGEAQLLSLAFVGSVASEAFADHSSVKDSSTGGALGRRGGFYPVVMDSPFGNLDVDYQAEVARALPRLAPQVVVMVSRSQGRGVESELAPRVGKCYAINYHTDKTTAEGAQLIAFGQSVPVITTEASGDEWAEFRLVCDFDGVNK